MWIDRLFLFFSFQIIFYDLLIFNIIDNFVIKSNLVNFYISKQAK